MSISDEINGLINKGGEALEKKDYDGAIKAFQDAFAIVDKHFPDNPNKQEIKKLEEMAKYEKSLAGQASQAAANEARHLAEAWGIKVEDIDMIITAGSEELKSNPNDASVKKALALVYYIRGVDFTSKKEYARAIADYNDAVKYEPDSILDFQKRGQANFDGDPRNYVGTLALQKRGQAYLDNGDFDKAAADFKELIQLDPIYKKSLAKAYLELGSAYDKKGDYASAISNFEESLKYNPDDSVRELLEMAKAEKAKH